MPALDSASPARAPAALPVAGDAALGGFHPAVQRWFQSAHGQPSEPQRQGWPLIKSGRHTLIAAPTGSGKTLAAFLAAIDDLVQSALAGDLPDELRVLYISPLKALSNDIEKNLQQPLLGIREELCRLGLPEVEIRSVVRTGDTPARERNRLRKTPPHILVTTPESLYILLTSESGRQALASVRTVIIDEIHALISDKRGAHLALSLERLAALVRGPLTRVGLSATQKPIELVAQFLVGVPSAGEAAVNGAPARAAAPARTPRDCAIVDCGHEKLLRLALELPESPLEAVMSGEVWGEVYDRLAQLVEQNTTTLVFVGNRRMAERLCRHLGERVGEECVSAHHGSLSKERRLDAERRLKAGELKALVATASLELGIDIGAVDLVCQIGSARSMARLLQRVGRSGHQLGGVPEGRVFPLSRNDLVECAALIDGVRRGELDATSVPDAPLDILAQQIVAMAACEDWSEDALLSCVRRAYPYRELPRERFDAVVQMLANGDSSGRARRRALIRHDRVTRQIQGRKAARLIALTNGGAIADNTDYRVVLEPDETHVGSVGEDFAVESMAGDIFQLGNASWRILKVESGVVRVADAQGEPPTIPFWLGEAPLRSDELSHSVSRLRAEIAARIEPAELDVERTELGDATLADLERWLTAERGLPEAAARQLCEYLAAAKKTLGALPTQSTIVVERFFDAAENTHLVIHSSFGARINRAWGLALRKRFCRTFNFELQAAAGEDAIILSLGPTHSFELELVGQFLKSSTARDVLIQALLDAPMFEIRWRHNATRALAVPRFQGGKKVPAPLSRIRANDLLATAFPDQQACLENLPGQREIPDHPLVQQTIHDCLTEAMNLDGFIDLLCAIERGDVSVIYRDLTEASPLAHEIINANPYAFLDPAPLEERRTQAIITRRFFDPRSSGDLGVLDASAIERVQGEAWPAFDSASELADALYLCGFICEDEADRDRPTGTRGAALLDVLIGEGRATRLRLPSGRVLWAGAERLMQLVAIMPSARQTPELRLPPALAGAVDAETAWRELLRSRLETLGPIHLEELARPFLEDCPEAVARVQGALLALEHEGCLMQGRFTPGANAQQWCERGLLARIHRYTLERLRREIEPVTSACFMRFLFAWQGVAAEQRRRGRDALPAVLTQLEGFEAAAATWEGALLPSRIGDYDPSWLDAACLAGQVRWGRMHPPSAAKALRSLGSTPIVLSSRESWSWLSSDAPALSDSELSGGAHRVLEQMRQLGACFFHDLRGAVPTVSELEQAVSELVAAGKVTADSFSGMRGLLPGSKRRQRPGRRTRARPAAGLESAGRWSLLTAPEHSERDAVAAWAQLLLRRYGVVFRALLEREHAPPWRDLLREYRRLEARGEVRGGRFVQRHAGEQFALPEAVPLLRGQRNAAAQQGEVCLSACDPLNLLGTLLPGERVAATAQNTILYRDAIPIAAREGGEVRFFQALDPGDAQRISARLRRGFGALEEAPASLPDRHSRPRRAVA